MYNNWEKKKLFLIEKTENKLESSKNKILT